MKLHRVDEEYILSNSELLKKLKLEDYTLRDIDLVGFRTVKISVTKYLECIDDG